MEVTENDIARIPVRNLRVPRAEFAAVWAAAERLDREQGSQGVTDWYAGGVAITCRWMAAAVVRPRSGSWHLARSPISRRASIAHEELIEAEYLAAELLDVRRPDLQLAEVRLPCVVATGADNRDPAATHHWFYETSKWLADGLRAPLIETPGAHVPQATHPRALAETLRPILGKLAASQRFEA